MNKIFYSILLFTCMCIAFIACSNGDYNANPSSNGNNSINPLNPLTADQFTWQGVDSVSALIDGSMWSSDSATCYLDTNGATEIRAYKNKGKQFLWLSFKNTWPGNVYNMGYKQYNVYGAWFPNMDSTLYSRNSPSFVYQSVLGNSGELYMIRNDTGAPHIYQGKFYFQSVNPNGDIINFSNGWFSIHKLF